MTTRVKCWPSWYRAAADPCNPYGSRQIARPLDDVAPFEEQPSARIRPCVRIAEDFAEHALVVFVRPEAPVAAGAFGLVCGRPDQHAPPAVEHALEHEVEAMIASGVAGDVLERVAIGAEAGRQPLEHRQHLVVFRARHVESGIRHVCEAEVGRHVRGVDRFDQVGTAGDRCCRAGA